MFGQVQDDLLPHGAPHPVREEVHLIHHDIREALQGIRTRVQHVAEHLGGHHHHWSVAVDRLVAGQQSDPLSAVAGNEIVVLLVTERLDRRCVEALLSGCQCQMHGELPNHSLACAGGRAHQHTVAAFQRLTGLDLETVELEAQLPGEVGQLASGIR